MKNEAYLDEGCSGLFKKKDHFLLHGESEKHVLEKTKHSFELRYFKFLSPESMGQFHPSMLQSIFGQRELQI